MFRIASFAAIAWLSLALSPLAQAQYDRPIGQPLGQAAAPVYGQQGDGRTIVCESRDGAYQECGTGFRGQAVIVETLSSSACTQGRTWGTRGQGRVWVSGGCRARFADSQGGWGGQGGYDTQYTIRCESVDGRQRECTAPVQARLTLLRQISDTACIEGQTWSSNRNGHVWVRGGCRGDFGPVQGWGGSGSTAAQTFRCESEGGRHQECRAPVRGQQMLVRQLSDAACIEGQTWGSRGNGVWVRNGCRGEFAAASGWGSSGGHGYGYTVTCESIDQRQNRCQWDARQGRPYLAEQLSQDRCVEGRNWGYDTWGQIWVDRGCRGRFAAR